MTTREIANKFYPILIMKMEDPREAIRYCHPWAEGQVMGNLIDKMPDERLSDLWSIIKKAKYKEDPKPIIEEMKEELKKARQQ